MSRPTFRLRELPLAARVALALLMLVELGGYLASGAHLREHHEARDERAGLTLTDLVGAYHGVNSGSDLIRALERGHPADLESAAPLEQAQRELLLGWLHSNRISEDYDSLDLGDDAPAEILAQACMQCHSNAADGERRAEPFLDYWDDVRQVAFSRDIAPTDAKVLLASTHTHAIALATVTLLLCGLMLLTRVPHRAQDALVLGASAGLAVDLAAWWLARGSAGFVYAIVAGGVLHAGCMALMMVAITIDLFAPRSRAHPST
jgi:hypothetical protein